MGFRSYVVVLVPLLAMVLITACTYDDFNSMYPDFAEAKAKCNAVDLGVTNFTIEQPTSVSAGRINLTVEILRGHEEVGAINIMLGAQYQTKNGGGGDYQAFNTTFVGPAPSAVTLSKGFLWSDFKDVNQCIAEGNCSVNLIELLTVGYMVRIYSREAGRIYGDDIFKEDTANSSWAKQHNVTGELVPCGYWKRLSTKTLMPIAVEE